MEMSKERRCENFVSRSKNRDSDSRNGLFRDLFRGFNVFIFFLKVIFDI